MRTRRFVFDFDGGLANIWAWKNYVIRTCFQRELPPEICFGDQIIAAGILTAEEYKVISYRQIYFNHQATSDQYFLPTPGADSFLEHLVASGYQMEVASSRRDCPGGPLDIAKAWLRRWFPQYDLKIQSPNVGEYDPCYERGSGQPKSKILSVNGDEELIILEDDPANTEDLLRLTPHVWLLDWPYNRNMACPTGVRRISGFAEAYALLKEPIAA